MNFPKKVETIKDQGGTRSGIERRQFVYSEHSPERRTGKDRRREIDRRSGMGRRRGDSQRSNQNPVDLHPMNRTTSSKS